MREGGAQDRGNLVVLRFHFPDSPPPPSINDGNRTEWSPIWSEIVRVINKIGRPRRWGGGARSGESGSVTLKFT